MGGAKREGVEPKEYGRSLDNETPPACLPHPASLSPSSLEAMHPVLLFKRRKGKNFSPTS